VRLLGQTIGGAISINDEKKLDEFDFNFSDCPGFDRMQFELEQDDSEGEKLSSN